MKQFSFPDSGFIMAREIDEAVDYFVTQEQLFSSFVYSTIENKKQGETKSIKTDVSNEMSQQEKFVSGWRMVMSSFKDQEKNRLEIFSLYFLLFPLFHKL